MSEAQMVRALTHVAEGSAHGREMVRRAVDVRATGRDVHALRVELERVPRWVLDGTGGTIHDAG